MTIIFENPGEIDPRTITTLGVNVKESDSPIGYFGTGLKYAIAVSLRNKCEVQVHSGTSLFTFKSIEQSIRGKSFAIVAMAKDLGAFVPLGFTTDLGKNWTVENAYRELHSNCLDEGGEGGQSAEPRPSAGTTCIVVRGAPFAKAHRERFQFLLDPKRTKICTNGEVEIYAGSATHVFYRGIAAHKCHKPLSFLYNITGAMDLTEDRTFASGYTVNLQIGQCLAVAAPAHVLEVVLMKDSPDSQIADLCWTQPSDVFLDTCEKIMKEQPLALSDAARALYVKKRKHTVVRTHRAPTAPERAALAEAVGFCRQIGFAIDDYPIRISPDLGDRIVALAENGIIWLSPKAFAQGALVTTLIEEHMHLCNRVDDFTRSMQDLMLAEIERLGRALVACRKEHQ